MTTERDDQTDDERDPPDAEETHHVDLDATEENERRDPDDDEDEEDRRQTRAERKAERGRLKDELEATRGQNRELLERVSRMEGALQQSMRDTRDSSRRAGAEEDDPLQAELDDVFDQQEALSAQIAQVGKHMTADQERNFLAKARRLDIRKHELIAERTARRNAPRADPEAEQRRAFQAAYADVFENEAAKQYAKAEFLRLVHHPNPAMRKPDNKETLRLAMENTRKEFGMSRPAPTEQERARTSGVSRGGTGGGGKRENMVGMGKFEKGLADKAFPHIKDDKTRWNKWAQTAGKKMLERKTARAGKR